MDATGWIGERCRAERDRRRHPRFAIDLPGSMVHVEAGISPVHTMVRLESISSGGGRVRLVDASASFGRPRQSMLLVIYHESQRGVVYRVHVAWVAGGRLGLQLVARATPVEEGAGYLRPIRGTPSVDRLLEDLGRVRQATAAHRGSSATSNI